jgi:hypothetical protein
VQMNVVLDEGSDRPVIFRRHRLFEGGHGFLCRDLTDLEHGNKQELRWLCL